MTTTELSEYDDADVPFGSARQPFTVRAQRVSDGHSDHVKLYKNDVNNLAREIAGVTATVGIFTFVLGALCGFAFA